MGNPAEKCMLSGIAEFDDSYFGGPGPDGRAGRGCGKVKVLTAVSKNGEGRPRLLRMSVAPNLQAAAIGEFAEAGIEHGTMVESDGSMSCRKPLAKHRAHKFETFDPKSGKLKRVHIVLSNAKAFILGTYHGVSEKHMQRYLDEFEFRFNRRYGLNSIFEGLLAAAVKTAPCRYSWLVAEAK